MMREDELNEMADTFCWLQTLTFEQFLEVMKSGHANIHFKHREHLLHTIRGYVAEHSTI
ncbi:hypothetical protein D3C71_448920 [compost metagenome]